MRPQRSAFMLVLAILVTVLPRTAAAHRLDEYLQAVRISIEIDRVVTEINLTPGTAVAEDVLAGIDKNHDGSISPAEGAAYGEHVVRSLHLEIDGRPLALSLESHRMPPPAEMRRGEGILRLRAAAAAPPASAGRHRLMFANTHRSDISAYLINALIPSDPRIRITGQSRDTLQHEFSMDYTVSAPDSGVGRTWLERLIGPR